LVSVNLSQSILAVVLHSALWFMTTVLTLSTCPAAS